jgi:hypothetical protein
MHEEAITTTATTTKIASNNIIVNANSGNQSNTPSSYRNATIIGAPTSCSSILNQIETNQTKILIGSNDEVSENIQTIIFNSATISNEGNLLIVGTTSCDNDKINEDLNEIAQNEQMISNELCSANEELNSGDGMLL